jgi:hypothetical protein
MHQKVQKTNLFVKSPKKVENFDKKCLTLLKENQKSPFKQIRFGKSKFSVKGLIYGTLLKLFYIFVNYSITSNPEHNSL